MPDNLASAKSAQELLEQYGAAPADQHLRQLPGEGQVSGVLTDLMHYCSLQGLQFDRAMDSARWTFASERADEGRFAHGACVELVGKAADQAQQTAMPTRGMVTGIADANGRLVYHVRCPGDRTAHPYLGEELRLTPQRFGPVETTEGLVRSPLDAEQAVLGTCVQLLHAEKQGQPPHPDDVRNLDALFDALVDWTGLPSARLNALLAPQVASAYRTSASPGTALGRDHPAQVAAADRATPDLDLTAPTSQAPGAGPSHGHQPRTGPHR
ncbi:hypothetical protein [Actinomadura harenae]|uniref:Uncharacterized protein n=1 Tax=Actinomadura harenae TaxID=2483351 RepID=A0A3M2M3D3_9ACTN|nr:hypothetical protein [Actinomadura harenae]RMI43922.1 hypothetical protein EBO15_14560 [Actinomadura harenae]